MEPTEIQAKATIAAALIAAHVVDVSSVPMQTPTGRPDQTVRRLHELIDYVYRAIVGSGM